MLSNFIKRRAESSSIVASSLGAVNRASTDFRDGSYVVIDWNESSVAVYEMSVQSNDVTIGRSFFEELPAAETSAAEVGEWLKQRLRQNQITATNAIVSVPRRSVSLRLLEFPGVADDELASLVELQVETQLDAAASELPFDFLPQPFSENATHRHAMLATVTAETLQNIRSVMATAGLTLKASGVGELALDALSESPNSGGLTLNILANHSKAEFVTSFRGIPVAAHSAPMPANAPEQLAATIPAVVARTLAGLPEPFRSESLSRIQLLGPFADQLHLSADQATDANVTVVRVADPSAVRPIALVRALKQSSGTINFVSRKRPVDVKQARRQQWIRYGIGAAVLMGLIGLWQHLEKRDLENKLAALTTAGGNLTELNERGTATLQEWQYVSDWQSSSKNWSNEVRTFTEFLPDPGDAYLTRLQIDQPSGDRAPVVRMEGIAKDSDVAMSMSRRVMSSDKKYELLPHGIEPATQDADFEATFQIEAVIGE